MQTHVRSMADRRPDVRGSHGRTLPIVVSGLPSMAAVSVGHACRPLRLYEVGVPDVVAQVCGCSRHQLTAGNDHRSSGSKLAQDFVHLPNHLPPLLERTDLLCTSLTIVKLTEMQMAAEEKQQCKMAMERRICTHYRRYATNFGCGDCVRLW